MRTRTRTATLTSKPKPTKRTRTRAAAPTSTTTQPKRTRTSPETQNARDRSAAKVAVFRTDHQAKVVGMYGMRPPLYGAQSTVVFRDQYMTRAEVAITAAAFANHMGWSVCTTLSNFTHYTATFNADEDDSPTLTYVARLVGTEVVWCKVGVPTTHLTCTPSFPRTYTMPQIGSLMVGYTYYPGQSTVPREWSEADWRTTIDLAIGKVKHPNATWSITAQNRAQIKKRVIELSLQDWFFDKSSAVY
jgi:hypothetical protein